MADRPHGVTIAFALIALVTSVISILISGAGLGISGVGLYFSHRALRLNEAASRAVVGAASLTLTTDWHWNPKPGAAQEPIKVQMVVSNSGKTLATGIRMQFWPNLCSESPVVDEGSDKIPEKKCFAPVDTLRGLDDLGPGATKPYEIVIDVTQKNVTPSWSPGSVTNVSLSPAFAYSDVNGEHYDQPCFRAVANAKGIFPKGPIPPCASHLYYPEPLLP